MQKKDFSRGARRTLPRDPPRARTSFAQLAAEPPPLQQFRPISEESPRPAQRPLSEQQIVVARPPMKKLAPPRLRPLEIAPESTKEARKALLAEWVESFCSEMDLHHSTTVTADYMLQHVFAATSHLPSPNSLRLAVAALLMERLCGVIGRYDSLLRTLMQEILSAVFLPPGSVPQEEYLAQSLHSLGIKPDSGIQRYLCRKPYFEGWVEVQEKNNALKFRLDQVAKNRMQTFLIVHAALSRWQGELLACAFRAWRGLSQRSKQEQSSLNSFVVRLRNKDVLQTNFYAWRFVVASQISHRTIRQLNDGAELLIRKEIAANAKLLEVQDAFDEVRVNSIRLKEQSYVGNEEKVRMKRQVELSLYREEEWQEAAMKAINFIGSIRDTVTSIRNVGGEEFVACGEIASVVILGWVRSLISKLPQGAKTRSNNFGVDMRDGKVYVLLLHILTQGDVELSNLEHSSAEKRMEVVVDAVTSLNIHCGLTPEDLLSGSTDYAYLFLFHLWSHFAQPPTPSGAVGSENDGFRESLTATQEYLETCRTYYPQWLENRGLLLQYALYLMNCRSKGIPGKVMSAQELQDITRDMQFFAIDEYQKHPDVFLTITPLTPTQRLQNEEEKQRVNSVVRKHIQLVCSAFKFYSELSVSAEGEKKTDERKGRRKPAAAQALTPYGSMDFIGFYRFCEDCGMVSPPELVEATPQGKPTAKPSAKPSAKPKAVEDNSNAEPKAATFTKSQIYQLFVDTMYRMRRDPLAATKSISGLSKEARLQPAEWIAAVMQIAILRYASPVVAGSAQPAPGAMALGMLITKELAPHAGVNRGSPFDVEMWSPAVQTALQKRRKTLIPLFEGFTESEGILNFAELESLLQACGIMNSPFLTHELLEEIFMQVQAGRFQPAATEPSPAAGQTPAATPVATPTQAALPQQVPTEHPSESHCIVYGEFEILLSTISVFFRPSPFIPLHKKLDAFLETLCSSAAQLTRAMERKKAEAEAAARKANEERVKREAEEREAKRKLEEEAAQKVLQEEMFARMAASAELKH